MATSAGPDRWFFDAWSHIYDAACVQRAVFAPEHDAVLAALRADPPRVVLDVGCGTGQLAHRLRAELRAACVVGCDFSGGMLDQARARDRLVRLVRGDAMRLPFAAAQFDAVVATEAFHWFPDQGRALREMARVLRPGGRLVLSIVMPPVALVRWLVEVGSRLLGQPFHLPGMIELHAAAIGAGLRVESQRRIFRVPGLLLSPVLTVARRTDAA